MSPPRNGNFLHDGNNRGSNVVLGSTQNFGGDSNIGNNGIHVTFIQHVTRPASTSPSLDGISEQESDSSSNSPGWSTVSTQGVQSEDGRRRISEGRLRGGIENEKKSERNICEVITTPHPFNPRLRQYEPEANANFPDRKVIATTSWPERNVRIYFQDLSNNIREASQTGQNPGKWHITPSHIGINDAKQGTALAVISRYTGSEIRLYYISELDTIHEWCFFEGQGWSRGTLNDSTAFILPGSQLAAVASARVIHVYYQSLDGVINEYSFLDTEPGWKHAKTHVLAIRGSAIAATAFPGREALEVHLYCQGEDLAVREYLRLGYFWQFGEFPELKAKIYTALAALSWESRTTQIRVYCRSDSGKLVELQYDGDEWEESEDKLVALNSIADDAQLAVIRREMSGSSVLQAYFVSGKDEIGEVLCNTSTKWLLPIAKFSF